jgi:hypothetical protein
MRVHTALGNKQQAQAEAAIVARLRAEGKGAAERTPAAQRR